MAGMPKERQTLFFSATLSPTIEKLIGEFLHVLIRVSVKKGDTEKMWTKMWYESKRRKQIQRFCMIF